MIPPEWFDDNSKRGTNMSKVLQVGSFNLIIDEGHTDLTEVAKKNSKTKGASTTLWR